MSKNPTLKECNFYHGAIIAHLLNQENPLNLRLLEKEEDDRGVYRVSSNEKDYVLFCRYSAKPVKNNKRNSKEWQFTFTQTDVERLKKYLLQDTKFFLILVCVAKTITAHVNEAYVLDKEKIEQLMVLNTPKRNQAIRVRYETGKSLWAHGVINDEEICCARNLISSL